MQAAAHFKIILSRTRTPPQAVTKFVTEDTLGCAVFVAQQWLCWSNDKGRGKRVKFERFRVDMRNNNGVWQQVADGDLDDAKKSYREKNTTTPEIGAVEPLARNRPQTRRVHNRVDRRKVGVPQTRLARLVAQVKART